MIKNIISNSLSVDNLVVILYFTNNIVDLITSLTFSNLKKSNIIKCNLCKEIRGDSCNFESIGPKYKIKFYTFTISYNN